MHVSSDNDLVQRFCGLALRSVSRSLPVYNALSYSGWAHPIPRRTMGLHLLTAALSRVKEDMLLMMFSDVVYRQARD